MIQDWDIYDAEGILTSLELRPIPRLSHPVAIPGSILGCKSILH